MDWDSLLKLVHVLSAMALVTGLIGRWIVNARAAHSEFSTMDALLAVSAPFASGQRLVPHWPCLSRAC